MDKNIGKNIDKNLSCKYSQQLLDPAKQSATDTLKITPKRVIQKTAEATVDLIGKRIANRITKAQEVHCRIIQKQLQMNMIKKYLRKDVYLQKKKHKIFDELIQQYNNGT